MRCRRPGNGPSPTCSSTLEHGQAAVGHLRTGHVRVPDQLLLREILAIRARSSLGVRKAVHRPEDRPHGFLALRLLVVN